MPNRDMRSTKPRLARPVVSNPPSVHSLDEDDENSSDITEEEPHNLVSTSAEKRSLKVSVSGKELNNQSTQAEVIVPFKSSIVKHLKAAVYDWKRKYLLHELEIGKLAVKGSFERLRLTDCNSRFHRRITEIAWHPKEPYFVGAACKGGDLLLLKGSYDRGDGDLKFTQKLGLKGPGPGGAVFAIRFEENRNDVFYTAGLEGVVNSYNVERGVLNHEFYNTQNYSHWFTSMDVSQPTRTLLAGCTKGKVYLSTLDGEKVLEVRLHKGKVLHCEFNQSVPHLIVTSSIDKTVKLWDLRKLSENSPLSVLQHEKPVNVAHFNPSNNARLLTSDQKDEVRIYEGPLWTQTMRIIHPHRQFQHLTAIVAHWHPLTDIVVIGKYPVVPKGTKPAPPRPIQFFDADTGVNIHELFPPTNEIVSLNLFSPTGEVLASGQGRTLLFFNAQDPSEMFKKLGSKSKFKNGLHFDRHRGSDDDDDDDDQDNSKPKRKKLKTASSSDGKKATRGNKNSKVK